jgi:hypothetical protein
MEWGMLIILLALAYALDRRFEELENRKTRDFLED